VRVPDDDVYIVTGYLHAKRRIIEAGFANDIDWAEGLAKVVPDAHYVMRETAWVIINSGFRAKVAQKLWPRLRFAFNEFVPQLIDETNFKAAMAILAHEGKMKAIVKVAEIITRDGIGQILEDAKDPPRLTRLPFIGKITCYHLAKVLGVDVVKPDVHLTRAAVAAKKPSPLALCEAIRNAIGDTLTVVDSVLWRYGEQQEARKWPTWDMLFEVSTV
jgi:hypothetical protein